MDTSKLWDRILSEVELVVSKPVFAAYFSKSKLVSFDNSIACVTVNNPLVKEVIESRYATTIKQLVEKYSNQKISLVFTVGKTEIKIDNPGPLFSISEQSFESELTKSHLNPLYTFENFAVSGSNQIAYAAAKAVAQTPGSAYNPLFLYGGVGVGKTHLMQAIGINLLNKKKGVKVIFCTGEEFTNEIIDAIRSRNTHKFKDKFRNANIFLIDDVQFIAGKNAVQEEFFYTFNAIHRKGSQIVLTSDKPPSEISKLEERLRSRFEGGLLIDIQQPDFELRAAIILIKAKQRGIDLPMNVAQELANYVSDARRLEGFLVRIISESQVKNEPLSVNLVTRVFGRKNNSNNLSTNTTPNTFINAVAKYFGIKVSQLKGDSRAKPYSLPRQVLMYILRTELRLSLNEIGSLLGGRDHTTILHGVGKITSFASNNEKIKQDIFSIKSSIVKN